MITKLTHSARFGRYFFVKLTIDNIIIKNYNNKTIKKLQLCSSPFDKTLMVLV